MGRWLFSGFRERYFQLVGTGFVLSVLVVLVHGYHPYADDAAIYVAGIKRILHPFLFSKADIPYLEVHGQYSVFEPFVAGLVSLTRLPVDIILFLLHLLTIAAFIMAIYQLSCQLFLERTSRFMAVLLSAACFTLPIAGTAIFVMDPFITARSLTTPLSLFSVTAMLKGAWKQASLLTVLTIALHPIMGFYLLIFQAAYLVITQSRWRTLWIGFTTFLFCAGGVAWYSQYHPSSDDYHAVIWSRTYLFLSTWQWYEVLGLIAPLLILLLVWTKNESCRITGLCQTAFLVGATMLICNLLFVHRSGSFVLARLQMLRAYQLIYLVGIVMIGGWLGRFTSGRLRILLLVPLVPMAAMYFAQRAEYSQSLHIEAPWRVEANSWHQAFVWVKLHTPQDALFAANPDMMELAGEGHEGFRAMSERSVLGSNKDEGVAVLSPALSDMWTIQNQAQLGLDQATDEMRAARLKPLQVSWLLLPSNAFTNLPCPYRNSAVQVCRLDDSAHSKLPEFTQLKGFKRAL